jgi:UDP-glucose 4-epimerase
MDAAKNDSVLVTGGRGFIGRAVGKLLRREGYSVISVDQTGMGAGPGEDPVHEVTCDIRNTAALQCLFETRPIGGVIHLAGILPTAAQREPVRATEVNVRGGLNLLEIAQRFDARRFVFGSSLSVYGTCPADEIVPETRRTAPEDIYGVAKLYVEQLGAAYSARHGLEFVSMRIGRVVGAGSQSTTSAWRSQIFELLSTRKATEIEIPYVASERILLVHVDDVAQMLMALLRAPRLKYGIYNAVCESVVVADLKREVEALNPNLQVRLGKGEAMGNPRRLDSERFQREFNFTTVSIFEQLRNAVGE